MSFYAELFLAKVYGGGLPPDTTWGQLWELKVVPQLPELAEHTRSDYTGLWKSKLAPMIADEPVRDMDWTRANEVLTSISAPSTQRYAGRLLKKMCNLAIRDKGRLLAVNPVFQIDYAKPRRAKKVLVESPDVHRLMGELRGAKYEPVILAELGGGMRPEEADALLWEDLRPYEYKGATYCNAKVDKAVTCVNGRKVFKDTKNTASERVTVIGEPFASALLALADGRSGPVCPSGKAEGDEPNETWYTSPNTITHNFRQWYKSHGLPCTCQEHMRSSYATIAGEAMVPDSIVEGNMGHAGSTTKTRHYQQVTIRSKCHGADLIAEYLDEFRQS